VSTSNCIIHQRWLPSAPRHLFAGWAEPAPDIRSLSPEVESVRGSPALHCLDFDDARHRLDGAGDLRRDLVAAGKPDLDLGAGIEQQDDVDLAVALAVETLGHGVERKSVPQEDAQALLNLGGGGIERLDALDAGAHLVALRLRGHDQQDRT